MQLRDWRILRTEPMIRPIDLFSEYPLSDVAEKTVSDGRQAIEDILDRKDQRKIMIVGPCSVHNPDEAVEYALQLKELADEVKDKLLLVMRSYFEKPRTKLGWRGLIRDPNHDGSCDINLGYRMAREFLLRIANLGLPSATEYVDLDTPQYVGDFISWAAIGARTTESPAHREMGSGLSTPVGYKNTTSGSIEAAVNSVYAAAHGTEPFPGIDIYGKRAKLFPAGNPYAHLILRGGNGKPNYKKEDIQLAKRLLATQGLPQNIIIDCSHDNCIEVADGLGGKNYRFQCVVLGEALNQILEGEDSILGFMIESNLFEGNQKLVSGQPLNYGVSITDACIGMDDTKSIIRELYCKLPAYSASLVAAAK